MQEISGSKIDSRTCDGDDNQKWEAKGPEYQIGDEWDDLKYQFKNKKSGRYLDISGKGKAQTYSCNSGDAQKFSLKPATGPI